MKRTIWILTVLSVLLGVAGCGIGSLSSGNAVLPTAAPTQPTGTTPTSVPTEPVQTQSTAPTQPEETAPVIPAYQIPLTAIAMPQVKQTDTAEGGGTVFTYAYPNITFVHPDTEVARTVLLELRNRIEAYRSEADSLNAAAVRIFETTGTAPDHAMTVTCDPMRVDQSVLSLVLRQQLRSDTAQGSTSIQTVTYDLASGKPLTLSQLLAEDASADLLQSMLADCLSRQTGIYSWYGDILSELFAGNTLPENWYLSADGLCFCFAAYELAPNAVEVTVPYGQLNGVIRDRYYLPEYPQATGSLDVIPFAYAQLSRFSAFAEVALNDTESAWLIFPTDAVCRLRIRSGDSGCVIFATDVLTAEQAIRLQCIPDTSGEPVQICYLSDGTQQIRYLRVNEADGTVSLSSE